MWPNVLPNITRTHTQGSTRTRTRTRREARTHDIQCGHGIQSTNWIVWTILMLKRTPLKHFFHLTQLTENNEKLRNWNKSYGTWLKVTEPKKYGFTSVKSLTEYINNYNNIIYNILNWIWRSTSNRGFTEEGCMNR